MPLMIIKPVLHPLSSMAEEASTLLTKCPLVGRATDKPVLALADTFGVSKAFVQDLLGKFKEKATKKAAEVVAGRRGSISVKQVSSVPVSIQWTLGPVFTFCCSLSVPR